MKVIRFAIPLLVLALSHTTAKATPITYDFSANNIWSTNTDPGEFGTGVNISLQVDGGTDVAGTTSYSFTDIQSMSFSAIGGTFSTSGTPGTSQTSAVPALVVDDITGIATLELGYQGEAGYDSSDFAIVSNASGHAQIAQLGTGGGYVDLYWNDGSNNYAYALPMGGSPFGPLFLTSAPTESSSVPEPGAFFLTLPGLFLLVAIRRRSAR